MAGLRLPIMALNVVCCETAIRLKSGAKRKWLAHAQNVADDPSETSTGRASPCRNNISGPTGAGALERDVQMAPAEVSPKRFRWAALSIG